MKKAPFQRGYTLVELLLVFGVMTAGVAVIFGVSQLVGASQKQDETAAWARATSERVAVAFASASNYRHLSQQQAIEDGLFGPEATVEQGRVRGPWGGEVALTSAPAQLHGRLVEHAAFALVLRDIPADMCAPLATSFAQVSGTVAINGREVGGGGEIDVGQVGMACAQASSELQLTFVRADASEGLTRCLAPNAPQQQSVACPSGMTGERIQQREGRCTGAYGEVQWSPWAFASETCAPCPSPETRVQGCPPRQYGSQQQQRSYNCEANGWNAWEITQDSCEACPEDEERRVACPGGAGEQLEKRRFHCTLGEWGPWYPEGSETCLSRSLGGG